MIIAAVDTSGSINMVPGYQNNVYQVLSSLKPPIRVIHWSNSVKFDQTYTTIDKSISAFTGDCYTKPQCFFERLPIQTSIELYIFTDGRIDDDNVEKCRSIVSYKKIQFSQVHLNYIGYEHEMNLKFTDVFQGIPQTIHINGNYIGSVKPDINFDTIDYEDVMKDDSFKATILSLIKSGEDKVELKKKICLLSTRILQKFPAEHKLSISPFYAARDVEGCIQYVKNHSYFNAKADFQRKISDILTLFDSNTDIYSLKCFKPTPKSTLNCSSDDEESEVEVPKTEQKYKAKEKVANASNAEEEFTKMVQEEEVPLERAYLTCDILYEKCQLACIPVKMCQDDVWPEKKILKNPFKLLESDFHIQRILHQVEPFVMDYEKTYQKLKKNSTKNSDIPEKADIRSPFSRDALHGVYILHNDHIDVQALIKHNNYVLSTFFQNTLPGKPVLWHMIFLYIVAMNRFQDKKDVLFEEIRFLGKHDTYFITLSPHLNPPIVDDLNCCFWYIAHVCPKAFPNSKKNVLRKDFVSGVFLEFYRNVYEENYTYPPQMPLWQLWHMLCSDKMSIYSILSYYYEHEKIQNVNSAFKIILYREKKKATLPLPKPFAFLSQFSMQNILDVYIKSLKIPNNLANLNEIKEQNVSLYDENDEREEDLLSHVKINPITCHPYVTCPVTKKYWKECIGNYNRMKYSYVRLFKRYCAKYKKYPQSGEDLLCFLNQYVYDRKDKIPEVFPTVVKRQMNAVLKIYEDVMKSMSCERYLIIANHLASEKIRKKLE